jgi:type IV secretion system protein VirD4
LNLPIGHFNPLDWIKAGDPDAAENAFLLADALVMSDAKSSDPFWDEEAKALLVGVILYVATTEEEAANRHLGRVRDILTLDDESLKELLTKMFMHPNPVVSSTRIRTAAKDPKLRSSVLASVQSHTHFLESARIRESLATSDFKFEDLKSEAMTITSFFLPIGCKPLTAGGCCSPDAACRAANPSVRLRARSDTNRKAPSALPSGA